jgi:hypothetical protein
MTGRHWGTTARRLVLVAIGARGAQIRLHNPASEARPAGLALALSTVALVLQVITA